MKKILAISNSFGNDANRYFHGICRSAGEDIKIVTLYIGGCSLYRHYRNMLSEERAYALHVNGFDTGFKVSLKEALLSDEWDIVTYQQVSTLSGSYETYLPYLPELVSYARRLAPAAKHYIHAIWARSDAWIAGRADCAYKNSKEMYAATHEAYKMVAKEISADGYIPATSAMEKLYERMGECAYRDGGHANLGSARYMLGLVWYMTVFGKTDVSAVNYNDFDIAVTDGEKKLAEECAIEAVLENTYKK